MKLIELKEILNAQRYFIIDKRKWGKGIRDTATSFRDYEVNQMMLDFGEREVKDIEAFNSEYNGLKIFLKEKTLD